MTRLLLIHAGPTPWDMEDRVVGSHSLPLTADAETGARALIESLQPAPTAIYLSSTNEACRRAASIMGKTFSLRPRDNADLEEVRLGLWEGLTRSELRRRFPTVFEEWEERPFSVTPPEGESPDAAVERLSRGVRKILRRNRNGSIALVLRPLAMQLVVGLLRFESREALAGHLHDVHPVETIELSEEDVGRF